MTFLDLLHGAEILVQSGNPSVSGLESGSRRVKPGNAFVAMHGDTSDGNQFIDRAIAAGAVAIVTDSATEKPRSRATQRKLLPASRRAVGHHGHHGHEREKHNNISRRIHSRGGRAQERSHRNH